MELVSSNKEKLSLLEFVFIIFLFGIYFIPSVSLDAMTVLFIVLMYSAFLILSDKNVAPVAIKMLILIAILAFFYMLLTDASSIAQDVSNRTLKRFISKMYQYTTLYFPVILFIRVNQKAADKQKKWLAVICVGMMVYVIISTWLFLLENPDATRHWEDFDEVGEANIANYYFIYAIPMIISTVGIILTKVKGIAKVLPLGLIIVGILFLVNAQYTLSILITIIGVLIQIFRNMKSLISKTIFLFATVLAGLFLPEILEFAISKIASEQVTIRLSEIHAFLTGEGAGGYNLNGRLTLYWKTIQAFFYSPIWGNRDLSFDGHATFLTVLSDTGVLGSVPFYSLLTVACKEVKNQLQSHKTQFNVVITMFVMMGLTNPIHASMPLGLATWFLAPLIICMIFKEERKNENVSV